MAINNIQDASSLELTEIFDFCKQLVFKDDITAIETETPASSIAASQFISAYQKYDLNVDSSRKFNLLSDSQKLAEGIPLGNKAILTDAQRASIIANYEDLNPYYFNLKHPENMVPVTATIADMQAKIASLSTSTATSPKPSISYEVSRLAKDFDIIYQPDFNNNSVLVNFSALYLECVRYFIAVIYTKALEQDSNYRNFCKFTIVMMTIVKLIGMRNKNPYDLNVMDEYALDNFMYSFGITEFKDFPVLYKRRIVQNLNKLIIEKSTDNAIIDILNIFDFSNIEIYKHYLVKNFSDNSTKFGDITTNARFISTNIKNKSLVDAIRKDDYEVTDFNTAILGDDYWEATKEEVEAQEFDFSNTKYFSIITSYDIIDQSITTAYFLNFVKSIRKQFPAKDFLLISSNLLGAGEFRLEDLIIALNILVVRNFNLPPDGTPPDPHIGIGTFIYPPNIPSYPDTIDFSNPVGRSVDSEGDVVTPGGLMYGYSLTDAPLDDFTASNQVLMNIDGSVNITQLIFNEALLHNNTVRLNLQNNLWKETDGRAFKRKLSQLRKKFYVPYDNSIFAGYTSYTDYLTSEAPSIITYLSDKTTSLTIAGAITDLTDILIQFANSIKLTFNSSSLDSIILILRRMIDVFKSFTITLKDVNVHVSAREKYMSKLADYYELLIELSFNEQINFYEKFDGPVGTNVLWDTTRLLDSFTMVRSGV